MLLPIACGGQAITEAVNVANIVTRIMGIKIFLVHSGHVVRPVLYFLIYFLTLRTFIYLEYF